MKDKKEDEFEEIIGPNYYFLRIGKLAVYTSHKGMIDIYKAIEKGALKPLSSPKDLDKNSKK